MDDQKEATANETAMAVNTKEPGILFALIPDDETRTMTLSPMGEGATSIKLTEKTAKILISMLDRQIQEWRRAKLNEQKETAVGAAAIDEFHELVKKIESCMLESGLPYKTVIMALDKVRENYRCKGINFLNKVNIRAVEGEDHLQR